MGSNGIFILEIGYHHTVNHIEDVLLVDLCVFQISVVHAHREVKNGCKHTVHDGFYIRLLLKQRGKGQNNFIKKLIVRL